MVFRLDRTETPKTDGRYHPVVLRFQNDWNIAIDLEMDDTPQKVAEKLVKCADFILEKERELTK